MKRVVLPVLGAAVAVAVVATAAPAAAATTPPPGSITVAYDASGSTTVVKTSSTIKLGPSTLTTVISPDGSFTGTLPLPPAASSFKAAGLIPTTATVSFIPVGGVTGTLGSDAKGNVTVTTTAKYTIRLSNVVIGGLPAMVGKSCQTTSPSVIKLSTAPGVNFDILSGGTVSGTYSISNFANCGLLNTFLINLLIPGSGNTVTINLSNAQLISQN